MHCTQSKLPVPQLAIDLTMISYSKCISTSRLQKPTVLGLYCIKKESSKKSLVHTKRSGGR